MNALPDPAGLLAADAAIANGLVARLLTAGYNGESVARIDQLVPTVLGAGRLPLLQHLLSDTTRAGATAAALFCYGLEVTWAEAERALGADAVAACRAGGILVERGQGVSSPWRIIPFRDTMIVSDRPDAGAEAVMGPGPTTDALAEAALPAPGARMLDVGCGAGSLALAALRAGAGSACAIDINPRAVAVARANAALNRLELDCRCGDLLAPVAGMRFDLILSQPPYVVLPSGGQAVTFLHSGERGDELARRILAEAPALLTEGGLLIVHFDGPTDRDGSQLQTIARSGRVRTDIAMLAAPGVPPMVQAMSYACLLHGGFSDGYADAVRSYLEHCKRLGLDAFGRYLAVLRRSSVGWAVRVRVAANRHPGRADLDRLLAGLDRAEGTDADLLASGITTAPTAELVLGRPFGSPEIRRIEVHYGLAPWPQGGVMTEDDAAILDLLAGSSTVGEAVARFSSDTGTSEDAARGQLLGFVRDGLRRGMLAVRPG